METWKGLLLLRSVQDRKNHYNPSEQHFSLFYQLCSSIYYWFEIVLWYFLHFDGEDVKHVGGFLTVNDLFKSDLMILSCSSCIAMYFI